MAKSIPVFRVENLSFHWCMMCSFLSGDEIKRVAHIKIVNMADKNLVKYIINESNMLVSLNL